MKRLPICSTSSESVSDKKEIESVDTLVGRDINPSSKITPYYTSLKRGVVGPPSSVSLSVSQHDGDVLVSDVSCSSQCFPVSVN